MAFAGAHALAYIPAQVCGCIAGAIAANAMFALAAVSISTKHRASEAHLFAEVIATLGLILVIFALARTRRGAMAPAAVGAYIGAAYFFTSSTSFANPAITVGRMFSDTFAGIAPASVPAFVVAQLLGGVVAIGVLRTLYPDITPDEAAEVMVPHEEQTQAGDGASNRSATSRPRPLTDEAVRVADAVITMGCGDVYRSIRASAPMSPTYIRTPGSLPIRTPSDEVVGRAG